jgi:GNAT superfamily N-acetyltransferase
MSFSLIVFLLMALVAAALLVMLKPARTHDRCGRQVIVRPICRADRARLLRALQRLTSGQIRERFFCRMNGFSDAFVRSLCDPNRANGAAFVVTDYRGKEILGEARLSWNGSPRRAQFALFVDPAATTLGLGHLLMERLVDECHRRGIVELHGDVLERNRAMLMFVRSLGLDAIVENGSEPGIAHVRLQVPQPVTAAQRSTMNTELTSA